MGGRRRETLWAALWPFARRAGGGSPAARSARRLAWFGGSWAGRCAARPGAVPVVDGAGAGAGVFGVFFIVGAGYTSQV